MELKEATPAVEEEQNISLKDSSKKLKQKSIYSIVTTEKYSVDTTQAVQKRKFFLKVQSIPGLSLHNIEQTYS